MDPIVVAAGTALIGAIATDTWQQVKEAVTGFWRQVHPKKAESIGLELDVLREQVLQARLEGDLSTERALESIWRIRLQQLLNDDPALIRQLQLILDEVLAPALPHAEQSQVRTIIMTGHAYDSSTFTQIGIQNTND